LEELRFWSQEEVAQVKMRQAVQEVVAVVVMTHHRKMDTLEPQTQAAVVVVLDAVAQVEKEGRALLSLRILHNTLPTSKHHNL
jgi:hypothetical protein